MKIAVLQEQARYEQRVAAPLDTVKKFIAMGCEVAVQTGAGIASGIMDADFQAAGASIAADASNTVNGAHVVLCVQQPEASTLSAISSGTTLIGLLAPYERQQDLQAIARQNIQAFTMEFIPRISRAQTMDVLSSQSNLAGYRAVIDSTYAFGKAMPMMMTAAGTVAPAKVLVLGAGVAGLQAIATAKRLGAVVSAFDVRPAVKEQVQSLGAKFVEVPSTTENAETAGGYAKEMSEEYQRKQSQLIHDTLKTHDIAITTALIPGRPAPILITQAMVEAMKPGSVILDMAVTAGGNCPLSKADEVVTHHGVKVISYSNLPSRVAADASRLYARNLYNFLANMWDKERNTLHINMEDEITASTLVTQGGALVRPQLKEKAA